MAYEDFETKQSVVVVYTGEGKGKTSAGVGLLARALGTGWKVAFVQFIKHWQVGEHEFIARIEPVFGDKLLFYKGGKIFPEHSPKPIRTPFFSQYPFSTTVSLSRINFRSVPSGMVIGFFPCQEISSIEP